jgi:hypothetical protein
VKPLIATALAAAIAPHPALVVAAVAALAVFAAAGTAFIVRSLRRKAVR